MKKVSALLLFILSLGVVTMCGGGGDNAGLQTVTGSNETGTGGTSTGGDTAGTSVLRVQLTDKPAEELLAVNVTIASVRVHQSGDVGAADGGWIELPVTAAMPVDLLTLRNGVLLQLCQATLPAGNYQQVRLELTPNTGTVEPFNQSVTTADGIVHALDVPSDTIKILHSLAMGADQTTDLTLDFDAAESVRQRGNGEWFMQPVIKPASSEAGADPL
jgi:hypothetical protein